MQANDEPANEVDGVDLRFEARSCLVAKESRMFSEVGGEICRKRRTKTGRDRERCDKEGATSISKACMDFHYYCGKERTARQSERTPNRESPSYHYIDVSSQKLSESRPFCLAAA